jgi:hypothetical protein
VDSFHSTLGKRAFSVLYDNRDLKNPANIVAVIGLALGGVFGLAGTVVTERNLQAASWGILPSLYDTYNPRFLFDRVFIKSIFARNRAG